ncbi:two-component sensor histidine kinase [Anaerocolumna cellulosilytica]|uniref:histidine kinase n=1 Tax=Anaerocolumna cellulosilytica TaxID=433286 RepID=A0A6S6R3F7_9FIRM|nr:HAMP domain-containing sensor histidine kinase [Anaerocolumna cellulosilytica]MBB5196036.1 signal transduction histidine kinase [Anaerocolumna cellulosilytica]BCJ93661.1 two-component sensor histidine kinase [Anaerocolumna cellulosilytica]
MKSTLRILKRFISSTMVISAFLLTINFFILAAWVLRGINAGSSPSFVVKKVAEDLNLKNSTYSLPPKSQELLEHNRAFGMLLSNEGKVMWSYKLPPELYKAYSLTDVAKFTKGYLKDYPVFVWEREEGIVVVGYPQHTLAKYQYILPIHLVSSLPVRLVALLLGNFALALLLSLLIGSRLIRSIRPLTNGIEALGEDKQVTLEPKGILSDLSDSINRASLLLQQRGDALKARDEARSNWIAGISHDIRTPLSMVLGYASDLEENEMLSEEQQQQAGIIRKQGEHLRALVNDLNLVSMLEYEMQPLAKKPIRLAALVRHLASDFLNHGLDDKYQIEIHIDNERTQVYADERLLLRAGTNLIHNSMKHNPEGCTIHIEALTNLETASCSFVVWDTGRGLIDVDLSDLLELPYSVKRKQIRSNGHGLGLPMAHRIAKAHQGELILSSNASTVSTSTFITDAPGEKNRGFYAELRLPLLP